ncbi:glycosyltransferase [Iningainema tapete]|uniref:Glycosyltransferase n=1 Tax=Iningainema tapete BLCC-T55 TaxID=2748662 RepID=A0A8J7C756_9CYAN|nr:glycosyltransferase [Iningainema tapete]MBD2775229.1 glycosyltransferase [Iningainema tapete BLCC-T55]
MTHFGIICPGVSGHLNPMIALARELQERGHRVTLINFLDAEASAQAAGVEFRVIAPEEFPLGKTRELQKIDGELSGFAALKFTINYFTDLAKIRLQNAPDVIRDAGIEALLVDQVSPEGGTIADYLGIPFITICIALPMNPEPNIPPFFTTWSYQPVWWAKWRNQITYSLINLLFLPGFKIVQTYRKQWNLPLYSQLTDVWSTIAQISQLPTEFDFPRIVPEHFYYTGPFVNPTARKQVDFPYEQLSEKPLIYASLGTLKNRFVEVFQGIAAACDREDVQLLISLGGASIAEALGELPGSPIVVNYAPQLELLKRASLCITHAGLNSVLESLSAGVPMVAIPPGDDQPGISARLAWVGAGEYITVKNFNRDRLKTLVHQVLTNDSYRQNARRLQATISKANGVKLAVDIIEEKLSHT